MNAKPFSFFSLLLLLLFFTVSACRHKEPEVNMEVSSPSEEVLLSLHLSPSDGSLSYSLAFRGKEVIKEARLGFETENGLNLNKGFAPLRSICGTVDSTYSLPWGENKRVKNYYRFLEIPFRCADGGVLTLESRVYDDGVGFRYRYIAPPNVDSVLITRELTEFAFTKDGKSWSIPADDETYELLYRELPLSVVQTANTPITVHTEDSLWIAIHEARLVDFPEMTLKQKDSLLFACEHVPWPTERVVAKMPSVFVSPWRVVLIGNKAVDLPKNNIVLNLNDECSVDKSALAKPIKYIGVWWGMHVGVHSWIPGERHGSITERALKYIDFAARHNIQGVLFEGWNEGWESWGGEQHFKQTSPAEDFDLQKVLAYAKEKGIAFILHNETGANMPAYERDLDSVMIFCRDHGIRYLKTGYAGGIPGGYKHHGQYAVRHYFNVLRKAAQAGVILDVHEPIKATGMRRTYPNMMTREGARGMEWNAWSEGNPPEHETLLPFTRLLGGPMDYTPGIFDITLEKSKRSGVYKKWNDNDMGNSRVNTTLAKQIALWITLYSPMQMAADMIENYEGHAAFRFFEDYDADIDESFPLDGYPGQFYVVARRAGECYYLGAVTNAEERQIEVSLDFLKPEVIYDAIIYADAPDAHWETNPLAYRILDKKVSSADRITISMAPGGGQAITFIPDKQNFN
ncbi:glycoside hydrolase family 97 protein [Porphyromonas macacae]|uniref:Retaining alpha-galactosidase n=1 Tax=Porphyromonas macacae TaxID=28115 RepID=A0A379DIM0_9PORP|nr:glycoside hydrolase family 97 protein [Porphyromonas macacae]SUB78012.1 Retaining alpha-galactosidase precursor [Porphyromonas macacae]